MKECVYALVLVGFLFYSCGTEDTQKDETLQEFPVLSIVADDITTYSSYPARVEGVVSSEIRAKVPGYITDVLIDEGQKIKKGQTLFKLETRSLDGEASAAKARMESLAFEVEKLKPLVGKEIVSSIELKTAQANYQDAKSNYESIVANVGYANIFSSVDGYVGSINYRNGALVSSTDALPLTRISKIDEVFIYFSMNEKVFYSFIESAKGASVEEKIKNFPAIEFKLSNGKTYSEKGKIEAVSGDVNQVTGTLNFRTRFPNPNGILRDGASGSIQLANAYENKILIPTVSTFERQNRRFVFLVENDTLVEKPIVSIDNNEFVFIVEDDLKAGDQILARGVNRVKEGDKIMTKKVTLKDILDDYKQVFK